MASADPVQRVLARLYGKPCWNVRKGYGSFLLLEFGRPRLSVREPVLVPPWKPASVRRIMARRGVSVDGEWTLWIYICRWTLFQKGRESATHASSERKINSAARELNGQALVRASVDPRSGNSVFEFDLGGRLETRRRGPEDEQWSLGVPRGRVLQVRGDGKYSYGPSTTPCGQEAWKTRSGRWALL